MRNVLKELPSRRAEGGILPRYFFGPPYLFILAAQALIAFLLTAGLLWLALRSGLAWRIVDRPNHRSLHARPIPRIGGLVLLPAALLAAHAGAWLGGAPVSLALSGAALALFALSLLDDVRGLSAIVRLLAQLLTAAAWAGFALAGWPWWLLGGVTLALVAMANFFNFMDGANGLAGGMALFGFGALAVLAPPDLLPWCLALAAAAAAFLLFNFDPARVFMGDAGSVPLGFLAAAIGLLGWRQQAWPLATPLLAFLPFWLDALVTLLRRAARGEKVWQAHREHYYQRLIQLGWSHRRTALVYYLLMALAAASAFAVAVQPQLDGPLLLLWTGLAGLLMRITDRLWRAHTLECRHA